MTHVLYTDNDKDCPESILDRNGDVVLGLCRVCGRGERELAEPCIPLPSQQAALEQAVRDVLGKHYECEDCWYSCPLSEDGCCNDAQPKVCNCGLDTKVQKLVTLLAAQRAKVLEEYVWTDQRPTKDGWYWWRNDLEGGSSVEIVQVHMMVWNERDGESRTWCSYGWLHQLGGEWQGPITPKEQRP